VSVLTWMQAQAHVLGSVISAVAANKPEPARQVLIYTAVLALIIWAAVKITKSVSK
jgi:cytochrome c biogenesis protein CcdA